MADTIYIAVIVAFFALSVLFVRACDRIIGPEELALDTRGADATAHAEADEVAA